MTVTRAVASWLLVGQDMVDLSLVEQGQLVCRDRAPEHGPRQTLRHRVGCQEMGQGGDGGGLLRPCGCAVSTSLEGSALLSLSFWF